MRGLFFGGALFLGIGLACLAFVGLEFLGGQARLGIMTAGSLAKVGIPLAVVGSALIYSAARLRI